MTTRSGRGWMTINMPNDGHIHCWCKTIFVEDVFSGTTGKAHDECCMCGQRRIKHAWRG